MEIPIGEQVSAGEQGIEVPDGFEQWDLGRIKEQANIYGRVTIFDKQTGERHSGYVSSNPFSGQELSVLCKVPAGPNGEERELSFTLTTEKGEKLAESADRYLLAETEKLPK